MIKSILFYLFRTDDYYTFSKRILAIIEPVIAQVSELATPLSKAQKALTDLDEALVKSTAKAYTEKVVAADGARDNGYTALKLHLRACENRANPELRDAASLLLETLRKYGWSIENESYSKESSKINNLLIDYKTIPELIEAITVTNSQEWTNELQELQTDFEQAEKERTIARANISEVKSEEACKDIRQSLEIIIQFVNIMQKVDPNETFNPMIKLMNEVIIEFNSNIRSRKKAQK